MENKEQDWIDKYRAAMAEAKPTGTGGLSRLIRKIVVVFGRGGKAGNKNKINVLTIQAPSEIPSREVWETVKDDDAA